MLGMDGFEKVVTNYFLQAALYALVPSIVQRIKQVLCSIHRHNSTKNYNSILSRYVCKGISLDLIWYIAKYVDQTYSSYVLIFYLPKSCFRILISYLELEFNSQNLHCKCLQGITGTLQGNRSAGISNLWGLHVYPQSL